FKLYRPTPPPPPSSNISITSLGICFPPSLKGDSKPRCRTTATATYAFHPPFTGRFRLTVDPESGEVWGVSWRGWKSAEGKEGELKKKGEERYREGGRGDFDIQLVKSAPALVLEGDGAGGVKAKGKSRGASKKTGGDGEDEEEAEEEKTFLQK
ncbi:MAG: hypothetical protein Q9190_007215, partial [Brigantiaea leucoxantha]